MKKTLLLTAAASLLLFFACTSNNGGSDSDTSTYAPAAPTDYSQVAIPQFSADSAYAYVERQLAFGNRIPGTKGWERCASWLVAQIGRFCDTVIVQDFRAVLWDGSAVPGKNIIGMLNPKADRRILLAAHWDSRSWADHDPNEGNQHKPVPGANDGASGAAVLLEMARIMRSMPPSVGVDFILFDVDFSIILGLAVSLDDSAVLAFDQHAHALAWHLDDLTDLRHRTDRIEIFHLGFIDFCIQLGRQHDLPIIHHSLLQRCHRAGASHIEMNHHVRKNHHAAQRQ